MSDRVPKLPKIHEPFTLLPCKRGTTIGMEGCQEHAILRTDAKIRRDERLILRFLNDSGRHAFVHGERSWLLYRKQTCDAEISGYAGGSIQPLIFAECVAGANRAHLDELGPFLQTVAGH